MANTYENKKIRINADPELKTLLPQYLENRKRDLILLGDALKQLDLKTVQSISHKIRGHAVSYGFNPLGAICTKIERAASEGETHSIESLLAEYRDYIEHVELA